MTWRARGFYRFEAVFLDSNLIHGFGVLCNKGLARGRRVILLDELINVVVDQIVLEYGGQLAAKVGLQVSALGLQARFVVFSVGSL